MEGFTLLPGGPMQIACHHLTARSILDKRANRFIVKNSNTLAKITIRQNIPKHARPHKLQKQHLLVDFQLGTSEKGSTGWIQILRTSGAMSAQTLGYRAASEPAISSFQIFLRLIQSARGHCREQNQA